MNLDYMHSTANPLSVVPPEAKANSIFITEDEDLATFIDETEPATTVLPVLTTEKVAGGSGHLSTGTICFVGYEV